MPQDIYTIKANPAPAEVEQVLQPALIWPQNAPHGRQLDEYYNWVAATVNGAGYAVNCDLEAAYAYAERADHYGIRRLHTDTPQLILAPPGGDPTTSAEDTAITKKLAAAGKMLDVVQTDHLVIGSGSR